MRHTETYNLNIIETDDVFSPDALNENTETLEAQLARVDAALDAKAPQTALEALGQGQLVYATGTYVGKGEYGSTRKNRVEFGFKPLVVVVGSKGQYGGCAWINGQSSGRSYITTTTSAQTVHLYWEDTALEWYSGYSIESQLNTEDVTYHYFALGVRE